MDGIDDSIEDGLEDGNDDGIDDGFEDGSDDGIDDAFIDGLDDAFMDGFDDGLDDGLGEEIGLELLQVRRLLHLGRARALELRLGAVHRATRTVGGGVVARRDLKTSPRRSGANF